MFHSSLKVITDWFVHWQFQQQKAISFIKRYSILFLFHLICSAVHNYSYIKNRHFALFPMVSSCGSRKKGDGTPFILTNLIIAVILGIFISFSGKNLIDIFHLAPIGDIKISIPFYFWLDPPLVSPFWLKLYTTNDDFPFDNKLIYIYIPFY